MDVKGALLLFLLIFPKSAQFLFSLLVFEPLRYLVHVLKQIVLY